MSMIKSGCGTGQLFEPTVRPTASFTLSGPETPTPTETPPPTDTLAPTEAIPNFYHGLAPTLEQFTKVNRSDIRTIIDYLASQQSLLAPGSKAIEISQILRSSSGEAHFAIACNLNGAVNCAPAASIQISEQGIDPHIIIWEVRNKDGSRGYISQYIYDSFQHSYTNWYEYLVTNPLDSGVRSFHVGITSDTQTRYAYTVTLFQQPGFLEAVQQWIDTGNIPEVFKDLILPW